MQDACGENGVLAVVASLFIYGMLLIASPAAAARNVILMIADGWGYQQVLAADYYQYGREGGASYEQFPVRMAMGTWAADGTRCELVKPTDSAASGTALATGHKTNIGAVGVAIDGTDLYNIIEVARDLGKSSGVVSSVPFSHATPATMVAHHADRGQYEAIANQMLQSSVDVMFGAGHPEYDPDGVRAITPDYRYVGGLDSWNALRSGTLSSADGPWTLVESRAAIEELAYGNAPLPSRVVGLAPVGTTLQQARAAGAPKLTAVPDLATLSIAALRVLNQNTDGFFLMVEAGAVDFAAHANQGDRMVEEMVDFNGAVDSVIAWIARNGGWENTALVVTGDHETGSLSVNGNNGIGTMPSLSWGTAGHTFQLIPLFAQGAGVERLSMGVVGSDPQHGDYTDNAIVGGVVHELLGGPPVSLAKYPLSGRHQAPQWHRVFDVLGNRLAPHTGITNGVGVRIEVEGGAAAPLLSLP